MGRGRPQQRDSRVGLNVTNHLFVINSVCFLQMPRGNFPFSSHQIVIATTQMKESLDLWCHSADELFNSHFIIQMLFQELSSSRTSSPCLSAASLSSSSRSLLDSMLAREECLWWGSWRPSSRAWATPPSWWCSWRMSTTSSWSPGPCSTCSTPSSTSLSYPGVTAAKEVSIYLSLKVSDDADAHYECL